VFQAPFKPHAVLTKPRRADRVLPDTLKQRLETLQ
jgi:hypothetical protein